MSDPAASGPWWRRAVIYEVYPRSFMDSDGDGVGDLRGLLGRLDYLAWLGADAVWLTPIHPSPMADFGYDVADYTGIDPVFGTLADFDLLIAALHERGLKLILDFVPNHTSDRHPWFLDARADRSSARRDWYIWRDPAPEGGPPNNWLSEFGGSAWEWDAVTGQFYYHAYLARQPDLNWRNPAVVDAMHQVLRCWIARGVDGFRLDAVHQLFEDEALRDNPPNPDWRPGMPPHLALIRRYTTDLPEVQAALAGLRRVADEYGERVLIGEAYLPIPRLMAYYGAALTGVHLPFNFHLIGAPWEARGIARLVESYEAALPAGAWPNWVLGNHDRSRVRSRLGEGGARLAAMLLLSLRGTPTLYYGDEIGMADVSIPPHLVQDPWERNVPGLGLGRDPARTPMRWDASPNAGFTRGTPWLPLGPDWQRQNVAAAAADPASLLSFYRALLALRRREPALAVGSYRTIEASEQIFTYARAAGGRTILIALNFSPGAVRFEVPRSLRPLRLLLSTRPDRTAASAASWALQPFEGVILGPP